MFTEEANKFVKQRSGWINPEGTKILVCNTYNHAHALIEYLKNSQPFKNWYEPEVLSLEDVRQS